MGWTLDSYSRVEGSALPVIQTPPVKPDVLAVSPLSGLIIPRPETTDSQASTTVVVLTGRSRREVATLDGHEAPVTSATFSPDEERIVTGTQSGALHVWHTHSGTLLAVLRGHEGVVNSIAFSPDGRLIASGGDDGKVLVWQTRSSYHPEAKALVERLFKEHKYQDAVIERLTDDDSLTKALRHDALRTAQLWDNPAAMNSRAWPIVRRVDQSPEKYAEAVRTMETACDLKPENGLYLNTLGVAKYRSGAYAAALETLSRSFELNAAEHGDLPADVAFLAMAHYQLGHAGAAKSELERLRRIMQGGQFEKDKESQNFLREAEELIEGEGLSESGND